MTEIETPWGQESLISRVLSRGETSTVEQEDVEAAYQEKMNQLRRAERIQDQDYLELLQIISHSRKPFRYSRREEYQASGLKHVAHREIMIPPEDFERAAMALEAHIETGDPLLSVDKGNADDFENLWKCSLAVAAEYVASSDEVDPTFNEYLADLCTS